MEKWFSSLTLALMFLRFASWLRSLSLTTLLILFVGISVAITIFLVSAMSTAFHGRVTHDFVITGLVASLLTSSVVVSIILYFVRQLRMAERALSRSHKELDARIVERTAELSRLNEELRREIVDRERAESERRKLEAKVQQSQRMEAIGRLAGGVAHDFNNVLCAITGNAAIALEELAVEDPMRESMEEISQAAKRASELTGQLLAFSRKQSIAPKVIDLNQVIESLRSMLVRLIDEDVILRTSPQKSLGRVRADPGQIEQVALNLAINARDAMPEGGELLIETADVHLDEDHCQLHPGVAPGDFVMLTVSDTGKGMDAEIREKIFEPFFTTKEVGQGTGLGLATVFGIVEQNGGKIEVESELGKGSSFRVYLPRVDDEVDTPLSDPSGRRGGQETVLVVEDEEIVCNLAVRLLTRLGYEVLSTCSSSDALELVRRYEGSIDLLFTDVVMPHMNGPELAIKLRSLRPEIKVLYTSGYTRDAFKNGECGDDVQLLSKPYSLDTLAFSVREALDQ